MQKLPVSRGKVLRGSSVHCLFIYERCVPTQTHHYSPAHCSLQWCEPCLSVPEKVQVCLEDISPLPRLTTSAVKNASAHSAVAVCLPSCNRNILLPAQCMPSCPSPVSSNWVIGSSIGWGRHPSKSSMQQPAQGKGVATIRHSSSFHTGTGTMGNKLYQMGWGGARLQEGSHAWVLVVGSPKLLG